MTYRAILIPLLGGTAEPAALETAIALTKRSGGHLTGLHVKPDPRDVMPYISEGASGALVTELMAATEKEGEERAREARKRFSEAVATSGIDMVDEPHGRQGATSSWREVVGREEVVVRRIGRMVDMIVMSWPMDADNVEQAVTVDAAMFDTARPVLLVPPARTVTGVETICLAWNGGPESARAAMESMPLMHEATKVYVLTAADPRMRGTTVDDLIHYLNQHGIEPEHVECPTEGKTVGAALLDAVREKGGDLLVMGCYGRSRISERVLGGVTRHVLKTALVPVLMIH